MAFCERALQPMWGASMSDSFAAFQAAARSGARANSILALQPLSTSLFEAALAHLHKRSFSSKASSRDASFRSAYKQKPPVADAFGSTDACIGPTLAQDLLISFQSNPKLLHDHQMPPGTATAASTIVVPADTASSPKSKAPNPGNVPALNLSHVPPAVDQASPRLLSRIHPTIPASPLITRFEWSKQGGLSPPLQQKSNVVGRRSLSLGQEQNRFASEALVEAEQLLFEKHQRAQQPPADSLALHYRTLKCPSPDLGYRIEFIGSNFNIYRPFDTVRLVTVGSSRTILNRAVAPLTERPSIPRRPHHGQWITFRQDFFDGVGTGSDNIFSRRKRLEARAAKTTASRNLECQLDELESISLATCSAHPKMFPRHSAINSRAAAAAPQSPITIATASPPLPQRPAVPASPRARKACIFAGDSAIGVIQKVFSGRAEGGASAS
jgi:hypothetical protein